MRVFVVILALAVGCKSKQSADVGRDATASPPIDTAVVDAVLPIADTLVTIDASDASAGVIDASSGVIDASVGVLDAGVGPCPGGIPTYTKPGCGKAAKVDRCLARPQPPCASHQYCGCDGRSFVGCGAATHPFAHAGPCK